MIYWVFFIASLMTAGYQYFTDTDVQFKVADINSAIQYFEQTRHAVSNWKENNPDNQNEIVFEELNFPFGYKVKKRKDVRFFADQKGFYIAFSHPPEGLAQALAEKYSAINGTKDLEWHLGYYHVGFKDEDGCLKTVLNYSEEVLLTQGCGRSLPAEINQGDLVITDGDVGE